jgi:hypothetical protein
MQLSKRNQSVSTVLPTYRGLLSTLSSEACSQPIKELKSKLHRCLSQRMKIYEAKKYLRISTLLDPRFKNHPNIFTAAERIENELLLEAEILAHDDSEHANLERAIPKSNKKALSDDPFENFLMNLGSYRPTSSKTQTNHREEIEAFFKVKFRFFSQIFFPM